MVNRGRTETDGDGQGRTETDGDGLRRTELMVSVPVRPSPSPSEREGHRRGAAGGGGARRPAAAPPTGGAGRRARGWLHRRGETPRGTGDRATPQGGGGGRPRAPAAGGRTPGWVPPRRHRRADAGRR